MKKRIGALLLMLVFMLSLCVPAFAEETGTEPETVTASGFYGIGTAANVTITPQTASGTAAESVKVKIGENTETLYKSSEKLEVTYSAASQDAYYGVILVEGDGVPNKDDAIFYIDQVTATNGSVSFNVYPILPTTSGKLTLHISSNAEGFGLISIPIYYTTEGTFEKVVTISLGDLNNDGVADIDDAMTVLRSVAQLVTLTEDEKLNADVNGDGVADISDAMEILLKVAGLPSALD